LSNYKHFKICKTTCNLFQFYSLSLPLLAGLLDSYLSSFLGASLDLLLLLLLSFSSGVLDAGLPFPLLLPLSEFFALLSDLLLLLSSGVPDLCLPLFSWLLLPSSLVLSSFLARSSDLLLLLLFSSGVGDLPLRDFSGLLLFLLLLLLPLRLFPRLFPRLLLLLFPLRLLRLLLLLPPFLSSVNRILFPSSLVSSSSLIAYSMPSLSVNSTSLQINVENLVTAVLMYSPFSPVAPVHRGVGDVTGLAHEVLQVLLVRAANTIPNHRETILGTLQQRYDGHN